MRILIITSYFPPSVNGWGYMQLCEEVTDGLSERGHKMAVLTSTSLDGDELARTYPVYRLLEIDPDWQSKMPAAIQFFFNRLQREKLAIQHLNNLVAEFRPDVIFTWHAIGLPRVLFQHVEKNQAGIPVYYLAGYLPELPDEYLEYWTTPPRAPLAKLFKSLLSNIALKRLAKEGKPILLDYKNVICVSEYVRTRLVSKNLIPDNSVVIHNGVNLSEFSSKNQTETILESGNLSCLIAGRIVPEKGIHTVILALNLLNTRNHSLDTISLTILGDGSEAYVNHLKGLVRDYSLQQKISFRRSVTREEMPAILNKHNVLILPSEYGEPLARSMQEAMAMGLLVIGTNTGGTGELLRHKETGFVFKAGDPQSLAEQINRASEDLELATEVAKAGQRAVISEFNIEKTINKIEDYLLAL